jgi:DNA invertase Pin-like site-specific DNA recombinase
MNAYSYLRTSADDRDKAGIAVQRAGVNAFAVQRGFTVAREFVDDGISGTIPMDVRPSGAELVRAIAENGISAVLVWNGERVGREQPIFWQFIGLCRAKHIEVFDHEGHKLTDPMEGAIYGMTAEMDHRKIVERLDAGKKHWRALGKRVEGRHPYGESPYAEHSGEKVIIERIHKLHTDGYGLNTIATILNREKIRTRYGKEFKAQTIQNILNRRKEQAK